VHGNLPAFEKMLAANRGIKKLISLGDVVNYGPWSNECVDLLETLPAVRLAGNHEEDFIKGEYSGESELVKHFFNVCLETFSRDQQIRNYEGQFQSGAFTCIHTIRDEYIYPDSVIDVTGKYFIGHSHYQFDRRDKNYHVVNVGSVGQNRKEINVINYAVFEPEQNRVELKSLVYDVDIVINEMKAREYPQVCMDYYRNKPRRAL
jgi:predicted phosphodiesterase